MSGGVGAAVVVRDLRKRYGGRAVLDGVTFEVARGELVALLGPNGAGKTTTVEILEGYRTPDEGHVLVLELDPGRDGRRLRPRLGLMLQEGGIDPRTTPREALRLFARLFATPADPDALLERVGLEGVASTRYRRLSGGERQRLGLALALVGRPELVVLDEPTAGMDPAARAATRDLIATLRADGTTILLPTHDLHDAERLADRVVVLDRGRIVAHGAPADLVAGGRAGLRFRTSPALDGGARTALAAAVGAPVVEEGGWLRIEADDLPRAHAALAAWCADGGVLLTDVRTGSASLEERYLELVGPAAAEEAEVGREHRA